jgi:hypothetical protein
VRINSLLHQLLGLEYTRVVDCAFADDGLVIDVAPTWREPRCSSCGYTCPGYDRAKARKWRHMDAAGMKLYLRYDTRRVDCVRCGVTVGNSSTGLIFRTTGGRSAREAPYGGPAGVDRTPQILPAATQGVLATSQELGKSLYGVNFQWKSLYEEIPLRG